MPAPTVLRSIWRYPVKSLQGEQLDEAVVEPTGLLGDRSWGIEDRDTGTILTGRREPRLLAAAAALDGDGRPVITMPDGTTLRDVGAATDEALSAWLGRTVTLVAAQGTPGGRAEFFADATDDSSDAVEWTMPPGRFVDAMPLLILTSASLRAAAGIYGDGDWDVRRFRPNLFVDTELEGWVEDGWCGATVRIDDVELLPRQSCVRCTMITRAQPGLERDLDIYKTVARHHGGNLGVWTAVGTGGAVRVGAEVDVVS